MTGKIRPAARERGLGKVPISIPRPVHARLTAVKDQLTAELGRAVTYGEVLEQLLAAEDTRAELEQIDQTLQNYGFSYPTGARGVADLAFHYADCQDELHRLDPDNWTPAVRP